MTRHPLALCVCASVVLATIISGLRYHPAPLERIIQSNQPLGALSGPDRTVLWTRP